MKFRYTMSQLTGEYCPVVYTSVKRLLMKLSKKNAANIESQFILDDLRECARNENARIYIAHVPPSDELLVIGMGSIFFIRSMERLHAEIHDIVVSNEARGKGVGNSIIVCLLLEAQDFTDKVGKKMHVRLTSGDTRAEAQSLYLKHGFSIRSRAQKKGDTNLFEKVLYPSAS